MSRNHDKTCSSPYCSRFVKPNTDFCDSSCEQMSELAEARGSSGLKQKSEDRTEDGGRILTAVETEPMQFEDLVHLFDVDQERWKVVRWNNWQQTPTDWLHQLKLKPRKDFLDEQAVIEQQISDMQGHTPSYSPVDYSRPSDDHKRHMLEVNPSDLHYGMMAWAAETGENYDSEIARDLYMWALQTLVRRATACFDLDVIVHPVGNDILHVDAVAGDGSGGTTTRGTHQDIDSRWKKMFTGVRAMLVDGIDFLRQYAPVHVPVIPGNHDKQRAFYVGDSLECWYRRVSPVTIDNGPKIRKKVRYGNNLLGFTHGSEEKLSDLPMVMANEWPQDWAETRYNEWHIGHEHRTRETHYIPVREKEGVRVRMFPSLAANDAFHYEKGYIGSQRACEAYVWNYETGMSGMLSANVAEKWEQA